MDDLMQKAIHDALAKTFLKYFPNAEVSNYGAYRYDATLDVPDYNGHHPHLFGDGYVVGNHQSREGYGWLDGLAGKEITAGVVLERRPFHSLLYAANSLRVMPLAAPSLPFHPWLAARSYQGDFGANPKVQLIGLADTDSWQELVFHTALTGATRFAHWNVSELQADPGQAAAVVASDTAAARATLEELNAVLGCSDRATLLEGLAPWGEMWLVTGMRIEDHEIYRVTPDLDGPDAPGLALTITSKEPATFVLGGRTLTFPQGRVHEPALPASQAGVWIVQPTGAPKPILQLTLAISGHDAASAQGGPVSPPPTL
ncbi:MAG: hypothetical protein EXR75_10775 [Myxococcales bacterium]|nr:hypothetical protein [Myxococcales bacterium]